MSNPKYQEIINAEIPKIILQNNSGIVEVIAGNYNDTAGKATTFTPINLFNVSLNEGADTKFNLPANYNTAVLVIEGNVKINNQDVPCDHLAVFKNDGEEFSITSTQNAKVLILSGQPINEPIVAHGPFVMNTRSEILQAFNDYNVGKFGYLEEA